MFLTAFLLAGVAIAGCDKDDNDTTLNSADTDFMMKASMSNTAEIGAGTIASTKATNTAVKAYAMSMVMEHSTAQTDLKTLSTNVGYPVRDTLDALHVRKADTLNATAASRRFDSIYIWNQVIDHQMTVANFQTHQSIGQHRDVKAYNSNNLPHIQMHLTRADSIANAFFRR